MNLFQVAVQGVSIAKYSLNERADKICENLLHERYLKNNLRTKTQGTKMSQYLRDLTKLNQIPEILTTYFCAQAIGVPYTYISYSKNDRFVNNFIARMLNVPKSIELPRLTGSSGKFCALFYTLCVLKRRRLLFFAFCLLKLQSNMTLISPNCLKFYR